MPKLFSSFHERFFIATICAAVTVLAASCICGARHSSNDDIDLSNDDAVGKEIQIIFNEAVKFGDKLWSAVEKAYGGDQYLLPTQTIAYVKYMDELFFSKIFLGREVDFDWTDNERRMACYDVDDKDDDQTCARQFFAHVAAHWCRLYDFLVAPDNDSQAIGESS